MRIHTCLLNSSLVILIILMGCSNEDAELKTILQHEYNRNYDHVFFTKKLNSQNENIRKAAIKTLGRIQDPESSVLLLNQFNAGLNKNLLLATIEAIGQLPENENAETTLIKNGLDNNLPHIRIAISEALGKMGSQLSMEYLAGELKSEDPGQREAAAMAIGLIVRRNKKIIEGILANLEINLQVSRSDSWAAAYAMFQIAMPNKIGVMNAALTVADDKTKVYLLRAIHKMILKLSEKEIIDGLDDKSYQLLLDQANHKGLWEKIGQLEDSPSWRVRLEVAKIYGKINVEDHLAPLKKLSEDENINVRIAANEAYGNASTSKYVISEINKGLQSKNVNIRAINIFNYSIHLKEEAIDALMKWSRDHDPFIKVATIKGLSVIPSPISIGLINSMTADKNDWVQIEAYNAMANMEQVPKAVFIRGLSSENPAVVSICGIQLSKISEKNEIGFFVTAFRKFNKPETVETAQDLAKAIIKIDPDYATDNLKALADPNMPQSYRILADHLKTKGDTLPPLNFSDGLKIYDTFGMQLPLKATMGTEKGIFEIEFYPQNAPQTVANFAELARKGYFDGLLFHRVIGDFVIQSGDPDGTGWGGPGYSIPCEYSSYHFEKGTLGLATAGKDTGGSQFFFCHSPQPHLNGRYTVFGKITKGYDILEIIERGDKILKVIIQ